MFLEISQNSQENTCPRVPFLIKLQASASNFIKKKTLADTCKFCENSKNTFSYRAPPVPASDVSVVSLLNLGILYVDIKYLAEI